MAAEPSTNTPLSSHSLKRSISSTTVQSNSIILRSSSNKLNALMNTPSTLFATTSTPLASLSLAACTETNTAVPAVRLPMSTLPLRRKQTTTSNAENSVTDESVKGHTSIENIPKRVSKDVSDDDSFDDEDESTVADSVLSSSLPSLSVCTSACCPVCLEMAPLKSVSCCTFQCCASCWSTHISASLSEGRIKISCPSNTCNKYLTRESILSFIRHDVPLHERYLRLYTNANQTPRAKTCPRCSHLYSLDSKESNNSKKNKKIPKQVQCSECSLVWCFRCAVPWHENLTCKQFSKGDKLMSKWIKQRTEEQWNGRKCPKCSSIIQRAGGCPHMTCSSCSCEFCYLCGRRYFKIPAIGRHSSKYSIFGCPYNLHPEKPWLRRTIRITLACGAVVCLPVVVVGAVTVAAVALPPIGIYKLVRHIRARRIARRYRLNHFIDRSMVLDDNSDTDENLERLQQILGNNLTGEEINSLLLSPMFREYLSHMHYLTEDNEDVDEAFPLSEFANMDVENLFTDNNQSSSKSPTLEKISSADENVLL